MSRWSRAKCVVREVAKLIGLAALLVFLMAWLAGAFLKKIPPGPVISVAAPAVAPKTVRAKKESFPLLVRQVGTVAMRTQSQVAGRVMGQVREVLVHDGQTVMGPDQEGSPTVLARLDDREIKARIEQAQCRLKPRSEPWQPRRRRWR